jgi:hypothetical protein
MVLYESEAVSILNKSWIRNVLWSLSFFYRILKIWFISMVLKSCLWCIHIIVFSPFILSPFMRFKIL